MFGILARHHGSLEGAQVLDLFAGSGALGIEALSRGAAHATFVDFGKAQLAVIRGNLRELGLEDRATVINGDAVSPRVGMWDVVFVDPPYASDLAVRAVTAIPAEQFAKIATIVIEHDRRHAPPDPFGSLVRVDQRRYGDTLVSFYQPG